MKKAVIAGNWKMNNGIGEAVVLAQEISNLYENHFSDVVDTIVIPPSIDLKPVKTVFEFDRRDIAVGAQNVFYQDSGAYTGEISISMISDAGCDYCIVGHSERREMFGETNEVVNKKIKALLEFEERNVTPIVCVGEPLSVRDGGNYLDYIVKQINAAFAGIDIFDGAKVIVAYEPIWAIGTGRSATPEEAEEVCEKIRATFEELFDKKVAADLRVLYGGSLNEGNVEALLSKPNIDGGLIGGASLKASSFVNLVKAAFDEFKR